MASDQSTYAEIIDVLDRLPNTVREVRRIRRLSLRAAAGQIGISFSTLDRFESRHARDIGIQLDPVVRIMRWLDRVDTKWVEGLPLDLPPRPDSDFDIATSRPLASPLADTDEPKAGWVCSKCAREAVRGYDDGQIPEHHRTCPKRVTDTDEGSEQ